VGFIGAGSVIWAYLGVLDRLVMQGNAIEGPICARRRETWPSLLRRRPNIKLVPQPESVIESDVSVVVVITPADSHESLTRLALEHGKHVVSEKPLGLTASGARSLADLAASRNLFLLAAPFVHLSPTFRSLWGLITKGVIGRVHSARGLYGNAGSRVAWHHQSGEGPLSEKGIYNLKSLTALLGPIAEVLSAEATAVVPRLIGKTVICDPDPDVSHLILRHESGALSSIVSSNAIQRYRRPGLELYGVEGTANLLGDDWDPRGLEIWRNESGRWEEYEPIEGTWHWADGLREIVMALRENRPPLSNLSQDLHLLDVIEAARKAARESRAVSVESRFEPVDLSLPEATTQRHHVHDHTRPEEEQ
jgi:predicted dehydrogenase